MISIDLNFSFLLWFLYLISSIICDDFKFPERGKVGELKVPNVLSLIDKQTAYRSSVEVINPTRNNLIHDYYDAKNNVGYVELEATIQDKMNRRYYYHSTEEKITVHENTCTRLDLTQNEKIESIKDWFEPKDIVATSEMFKDSVHLGPTVLMIYANSISDKASFIGSELIEGRTVNHWFYCTNPNGPYIDFYFDVKTSLPYRFSLYYPKWVETQEAISINGTRTVKKQVDSESKYVYNFYMFEPLVTSSDDAFQYPLGYGCARKGTRPSTPLPDFGQVEEFTMDMEAILVYPNSDPFKSTARVMKRSDVISYKIQEGTDFIRSIEMPPPLGRFRVDEHTGRCNHYTSDYSSDVNIITRWPYPPYKYAFNLLYYLVMKPPQEYAPIFIGEIPLGPFRVEEYRAPKFFNGRVDAIIDYYYNKNASNFVPSKVIFTKDRSDEYYDLVSSPPQVEVTVISYVTDFIEHGDRFDVSGCYEESGSYTWFQLLFSDPWMIGFNMLTIKESTEKSLTSFIPITRIGDIHAQQVDSNVYVTVKLYDRVHFIEAYRGFTQSKIINPSNIVQRSKIEDCEQLCSSTPNCFDFSYCSDYDCSIFVKANLYDDVETSLNKDCKFYSRSTTVDVTPLVRANYLSTIAHVLQQIRNKVSAGEFRLYSIGLPAEDFFIVSGPEEIGDISQQLQTSDSRTLRAQDFPMIAINRHFKEAKFKKSTLNECFMTCLNDDDCNTLSYCVNQNKECILSGETSSSLKDSLEDKTSHADGCNIYQKSFMNLFHEYPGKSLVVDAVSTISNVPIGDCAKRCAQSNDFNCESFDYCQDNYKRNESVCFLHVNHIAIDKVHQINVTNWKLAESGCSHYSKKSELDYEQKVGLALKDYLKESIVGIFDHLSLEHCASRCNSDPNCFTLEFCEIIDYNQVFDSSASLMSCILTKLKPSDTNQGKSKTSPQPSALKTPSESPTKSNNLKIAIGLGTIVCLMAFAGGFIGFKFSTKKRLVL